MAFNEALCRDRQYNYVRLLRSIDEVPPYWGKVFEIHRLLNQDSSVQLIVWLDSDAYLNPGTDPLILVEKWPEHSMLIGADPPPFTAPCNAGAFAVKNNIEGRKIFATWKELYDPSQWRMTQKDNGEFGWETDGGWAGETYEQGAFIAHILSNPEFANNIKLLPSHVFNEVMCLNPNPETVSFHLPGHLKHEKRDECRPENLIRQVNNVI
jgi:hypothetical protein